MFGKDHEHEEACSVEGCTFLAKGKTAEEMNETMKTHAGEAHPDMKEEPMVTHEATT